MRRRLGITGLGNKSQADELARGDGSRGLELLNGKAYLRWDPDQVNSMAALSISDIEASC